jgi:hypothetical protein
MKYRKKWTLLPNPSVKNEQLFTDKGANPKKNYTPKNNLQMRLKSMITCFDTENICSQY